MPLHLNYRRQSKIQYLIATILLSSFLSFADRGMIILSSKKVDLQESGQNAIIAWNGKEEVLILSTNIQSSESSSILEILPLPSAPLKVEEGSFDSFVKLKDMINRKIRNMEGRGLTKGLKKPGIELTFHKKIGPHDITVVKVNELNYFINWVEEFAKRKGLKFREISEEFKNTIASYLNRGMIFFVFDVIETDREKQSIKPLIYRFKTNYLYYPFKITSSSDAGNSVSSVSIFLISKGIVDKDIIESLMLETGAGFDREIALSRTELKEISPELEDIFRSDAFVAHAFFSGFLKRLKNDLVVSQVFAKTERIKEAREFFKKALMAKDLSEKESLYIKAIEIFPSYPAAHNNLGDVYERQGRFEEAIKEYKIASALAPNTPYPYFGLGDVYFKLGKYEQAIKNYEKGLEIESDDKEARENLKIVKTLNMKILFPFGSDKLTDTAIEQLKEIAKVLSSQKLKDSFFEIQGHTDSTGPEDYNLLLSQRRAEAVKKYLVEKCGIDERKLRAKGYGEDRPVATNETKEGKRKNRRVELVNIFSESLKSQKR